VRASHGLAGVMQRFRRGFDPSSRHGFLVISRFDFCQQILSADFSGQQICFCQQIHILSADFSS
jgi:hypothetical protein